MRRLPIPWAALALGCGGAEAPGAGPIQGLVLDLDGRPLVGASVSTLEPEGWSEPVLTDADGVFQTPVVEGNRWVRASSDGFLARVRAAGPGAAATLRLSEDDGLGARLLFGGSAMFARGYTEPGPDGEPAAIRPGFELQDVASVLAGIAPLFEEADLASLALESPLALAGTPLPGKDNAYASHPLVAPALRAIGVDAVALATDHAWDLQEAGIAGTEAALLASGLRGSGAGWDEAGAWEADLHVLDSLTLAVLSCSTIEGGEGKSSTLADDGFGKGGAAPCSLDDVAERVAAARALTDVVVLQLHGGEQLDPAPSAYEQDLARAAFEAGATLVVGHHPLVQGGIDLDGEGLAAWSLGPVASDLGLWETFPGALLEVQVDRDGRVRRAILEPTLLEDLRPRGLLGWPRQRVAREILARSGASLALDDGAVELDLEGRAELQERELAVAAEGEGWSLPVDLRDGWLADLRGSETWRLGSDLLRIGDFEDVVVDPDLAKARLWDLDSDWEWLDPEAAHAGVLGLRLARTGGHRDELWSSPAHRLPLGGAAELTFSGWLRCSTDPPAALSVQVSWYAARSGASFTQEHFDLACGETWAPFQIGLQPPGGAVAVNAFLRLQPPERGRAEADLDELRLIAWSAEPPARTEACDALQVQGSATAVLQRRVLPGAADSAAPFRLTGAGSPR